MKTILILILLAWVLAALEGNIVTVAIVGTNDIHGAAFPTQLFRSDSNQQYTYGGLEYMASMIQTIRKQYDGSFLYLDAGDQFQGGIESGPLISSGQIMNDFLNEVKADGSAIGNHQFDFGPSFLLPYLQNRREGSWNLAANLASQNDYPQFLPKHKNMWLYRLKSGINIGVIGLSTIESPFTSSGFVKNIVPAYEFKQYAEIVVKASQQLRKEGADAVVLVSHVGNYCNADLTFGFWSQQTRQATTCNETDEITTLLSKLPAGTIHGVVQGHRHTFSHHFIRGVPVMGTISGGYYFNILYLHFQNKKIFKKVIEGPIPVCQKIFSKLRICNYLSKEQLKTAGELVQWQFHQVKVQKHPQIKRLFQTKWLPQMQYYFKPLAMNELILQRRYDQQSLMGNLVTDLIASAFPGHHFVITNAGGFRTIWYPGVIQYQHFYNMFPFVSDVFSFEMTGYQLVQTLKIIQSGRKAFYPTNNLRQIVTLSKNGSKSLVKATFYDGSPIQLTKTYRGLSNSFLLKGGDDFNNVMGKIYIMRKEVNLGNINEIVQRQLIKIGTITKEKLIDPLRPRLIINRL